MQLSNEMKPTKKTLFLRKCKIYQFYRFIRLNSKILRVSQFPPKHEK
ncbi:hypothetical protein [Fervidibacillus halotolerans]|uniref:Uncharacterized protein n=1 Tax=Fervidibacillus halotolerans TaxID=2980027 RepID=A0A9E8S139_9BACI|nr:hypothetical protein [Fervidibacillus halotolerans]WAA13127.1 hypothetical protein OE105_03080 [Fervidibacillus halotolerans]